MTLWMHPLIRVDQHQQYFPELAVTNYNITLQLQHPDSWRGWTIERRVYPAALHQYTRYTLSPLARQAPVAFVARQ